MRLRTGLFGAMIVLLAGCAQDRLPELPPADTTGQQIPADNQSADTFVRMGDRLLRQGERIGAATMFNRARALEPSNPVPLTRLGDIAWQSGRLGAAAELYGQALQLDQSNPDALLGRARALALAGEEDAAMLLVTDLVRAHGPNPKALAFKAMVFDLQGDHGSAQSLYNSALEGRPDDASIVASLAYSKALEAQYRDAVGLLRPYGERQDTASQAGQALADIYALSGQVDTALALYQSATGQTDNTDAKRAFFSRLARLDQSDKARALYFRQLPQKLYAQKPAPGPTPGPQEVDIAAAPIAAAPAEPMPEPASERPAQAQDKNAYGYWAQVASFRSREALELGWLNLERAHTDLVSAFRPRVEVVEIADQGVFHRLYAGGFAEIEAAKSTCVTLREKDISCVVLAGTRETIPLADAIAKN